jgi:hypothetical protein
MGLRASDDLVDEFRLLAVTVNFFALRICHAGTNEFEAPCEQSGVADGRIDASRAGVLPDYRCALDDHWEPLFLLPCRNAAVSGAKFSFIPYGMVLLRASP